MKMNLPFALSHSLAKNYNSTHQALLKQGASLNGTAADLRPSIQESTQFQQGDVMVYANSEKQQVVLAKQVGVEHVNEDFVPEDVEGEVSSQTYRSIMKPNEYGTLEVLERVDSRDSKGEVLGSWTRLVESDPMVGGFSIHIPGR